MRSECEKENINLVTTAIRGKQSEKDLDCGEFKLNEKNLIDKCRDGVNPKSQKLKADGTITRNFDVKICKECPLRNKCITKNLEKQSRIVIDPKRRWLDERNKLLETETYKTFCLYR